MRTDYNVSAAQGNRYHNCGLCGKKYYESLLRACPERGERRVCAYCCRLCTRSYRAGSAWGCRAADQKRAEQAQKKAG